MLIKVEEDIERMEKYLTDLEELVSNTSVHDKITPEDFKIERTKTGVKLINHYDEGLKKKYQAKNENRKEEEEKEPNTTVEPEAQPDKEEEVVEDEEERETRLALKKWDPEL